MASNRLVKEYKESLKHRDAQSSQPEIILFPTDESNLFLWNAHILGPPSTPYEGHYFTLKLTLTQSYPLSPPKVIFITKVCHPNVHFKTGEICLDVLKDAWTPIWTLESICRAIISLLDVPDASSPLNCDAGNLIRAGDMTGFNNLARMYTIEYASKTIPQRTEKK